MLEVVRATTADYVEGSHEDRRAAEWIPLFILMIEHPLAVHVPELNLAITAAAEQPRWASPTVGAAALCPALYPAHTDNPAIGVSLELEGSRVT